MIHTHLHDLIRDIPGAKMQVARQPWSGNLQICVWVPQPDSCFRIIEGSVELCSVLTDFDGELDDATSQFYEAILEALRC